jgi:hypothetical protein
MVDWDGRDDDGVAMSHAGATRGSYITSYLRAAASTYPRLGPSRSLWCSLFSPTQLAVHFSIFLESRPEAVGELTLEGRVSRVGSGRVETRRVALCTMQAKTGENPLQSGREVEGFGGGGAEVGR